MDKRWLRITREVTPECGSGQQNQPHVLKGENRKQEAVTCATGLPDGSAVKKLPAIAGSLGSIPGWGRPPGEGNGDPLQYSGLGNPMDSGALWLQFVGSQKSWT